MDNLPFSAGWVYLIGSLIGIVTVSLAKTFSWKNYEFLASEDDRKEAVAMTPLRRLILIGICVLIGAYGAIEVQRDMVGVRSLPEITGFRGESTISPIWTLRAERT